MCLTGLVCALEVLRGALGGCLRDAFMVPEICLGALLRGASEEPQMPLGGALDMP